MLAALCLAAVFAISLSSYIALCYVSLQVSTRAAALSHASELSEAGMELALYELNNVSGSNPWTNWTTAGGTATTSMTMTSSGLAPTSTATSPLNYGSGITGQVNITVTGYNTTTPSISSHAVLTLPSSGGLADATTASQTLTYGSQTSPTTSALPVFVNAVAAVSGRVRFSSAGTLDSYSSVQPASNLKPSTTYVICSPGSTNWTLIGAASNAAGTVFTTPSTVTATGTGTAYAAYPGVIPNGYSAVVLSQDTSMSTATVRLNNAVVYGYAVGYDFSSPGSTNWLSYSSSGKVKGSTPSGTNIDPSRLITTPVAYQPTPVENISTLSVISSLPSSMSSDGATLNRTCTLGSTAATVPIVYSAGNGISLNTNQIVTIQGPVVIITYGGLSIAGTSQFRLTTPQASLQIFVEYGNVALGGNGITNTNTIPLPKKVAIMDTTNYWSSATISTSTPFYGVVYLPDIPITVSSNITIYGALVGSSVTFSGSPTIHYDLALRSPTPAYSSAFPLQSGAAFDNLSAPSAFTNLTVSVP